MVIKKTAKGYRATFWLFGYQLQTEFKNESEAYSFLNCIKSTFTTDMKSISHCIEKYKRLVTSKKSKASISLENHIFVVLCEYLLTCGISIEDPITKVSFSIIEDFQNHCVTSLKLNPASVNRYFSTLKNFFKKLEQWEYIIKNPTKGISALSVKPKEKSVWDPIIFRMVMKCLNYQDKTLLMFLKLTGARLSTATTVKIKDVLISEGCILFSTQKGAKAQQKIYKFPIYDELKNLIDEILLNHPTKNTNDYLLLNYGNQKFNNKNFAKRISKVLSKHELKDNTQGKHLTLHGLRHSFASEKHRDGFTVNEVKNLLGHASIKTTEIYLHSDHETLLNKLNKKNGLTRWQSS